MGISLVSREGTRNKLVSLKSPLSVSCAIQAHFSHLYNNLSVADKVGHLLGVKSEDLKKSLLKPRIKVGNEWVYQGRSAEQVTKYEYIKRHIDYDTNTYTELCIICVYRLRHP